MREEGVGGDMQPGWLTRDVIARQSAVRPDVVAIRELDAGRETTYRELEDLIRRCDGWLRGRVGEPGARVALLARNNRAHAALFFGGPRAGAVFVPLNWRLPGAEIAALLADAAPDLVIYEPEFEAALAGAPVATMTLAAFEAALASTPPAAPQPIDPQAASMLLYTSGTTGRPKGVIVTPSSSFYGAINFTYVGELTAGHVQLCDVPLFHVVGLLAILHATLMVGGTICLADRFAAPVTLARLGDPALKISHYFCVPQMAQALLAEPAFAAADLRGLRVFTGGAPMPREATLALLDAGVLASNGFGMSENGTVLGVPLDAAIARAKLGAVGLPSPIMEVRLVGPDGADVAEGEVGEIWLRSPAVTVGYWNQPEATARAFVGDWFRTGDAARRDADGCYFIVDRWKDMYISGGENVYPAEVEAVLGGMPQVADAAVVGVADARWGEAGCAFLVLRPGAEASNAEVAAWCVERLARYKHPAHVRVVDALPRTASGKVQKDVLRKLFAG